MESLFPFEFGTAKMRVCGDGPPLSVVCIDPTATCWVGNGLHSFLEGCSFFSESRSNVTTPRRFCFRALHSQQPRWLFLSNFKTLLHLPLTHVHLIRDDLAQVFRQGNNGIFNQPQVEDCCRYVWRFPRTGAQMKLISFCERERRCCRFAWSRNCRTFGEPDCESASWFVRS